MQWLIERHLPGDDVERWLSHGLELVDLLRADLTARHLTPTQAPPAPMSHECECVIEGPFRILMMYLPFPVVDYDEQDGPIIGNPMHVVRVDTLVETGAGT